VAGGGRIDVAGLDEWEWITEINLFGVVRGIRTFTPVFKQQRSGQVVNIASLAGLVHPAGMASYNAVKAGVVALSETVGHELAEYGVRCTCVCPSYFRTGLVDAMRGSDTAVGTVIGGLVAAAPLGPDEIAAAVIEGIDRGEELVLPDDAARAAYRHKQTDRAAYDALMRKQAARLNALGEAPRAGRCLRSREPARSARRTASTSPPCGPGWPRRAQRSPIPSRCASSAVAPRTSPTRCATTPTT
jgi:NAD(P)-dependent dehydrogenase (short-subunit alcohol dehydrogenase family)